MTEERFAQLAEAQGWHVTKSGWPDFLCFNEDGDVMAVEVKPQTKTKGRKKPLRQNQADCMDELSAAGIPCFVSDGETLEPYDRFRHTKGSRRLAA